MARRLMRMRGGRGLALAGRVAVWAVLAVVGVTGVRGLVQPAPATVPAPDTDAASTWEAGAQARAGQVAVEYLSWEPADRAGRRERLAAVTGLAGGDRWAGPLGEQPQEVLQVVPAGVRPSGTERGVASVAVRVRREEPDGPITEWVHLDVPVGAGDGDGAVVGGPVLVAAPVVEAPPTPGPSTGDPRLASVLAEPLTAFFQAYGSGDAAAMSYLVAPGVEIAPLTSPAALLAVQRVQVRQAEGDVRQAVATVRWALGDAELVQDYRLELARVGGRWHVADLGAHDLTAHDLIAPDPAAADPAAEDPITEDPITETPPVDPPPADAPPTPDPTPQPEPTT